MCFQKIRFRLFRVGKNACLADEFSVAVFFAQDQNFNRNFLGRAGWLDRLRIAIVDYDRMVFLSPYQSQDLWRLK